MRIAIAGAGIAGLTTALIAARAGFDVALCERSAVLQEVGAGLQLSPNAGRILDRLGLGSELDRVAVRPERILMRSARSGRLVVTLPLAESARRHGAPYRLIHRADLQKILIAAVEDEDRVALSLGAPLADPQAAANADLLVAADGVRSAIRAAIGGPAAKPTGRTAWRTTIPAASAPAGISRFDTTVFLGERSHVVVYPIRSGTEINIVAIVEEAWQSEGWSEPGEPAAIRAAFAGAADELLALIEAAAGWTRWSLNGVDPLGSWVSGRIALIGDAAHAMLPFLAQGAAMAIEDAAVLVAELSRPDTTVATALAAYQARRRPRVARVWRAAQESGRLYHLGGPMALARNATMATLGGARLMRRYDWIYGWTEDASS